METLASFAETVLIIGGGLALRLLVAVAGLALLVLPLVVVFRAWQGVESLRDQVRGIGRAGTLLWKRGVSYATGHTWLRAAEGSWVVGMDDLAQRLVPHPASVRLAPAGAVLQRGDVLAEVTCGTRHARIHAPIASRVVRVNDAVVRRPGLLNRDPYGRGWLALIAPSEVRTDLRDGQAARAWLAAEDKRFTLAMEHALGAAAADGGEFLNAPASLMDDSQWEALTAEFLEDPNQP